MKNLDPHVFQGMQRDSSVSKQKAEFLYDALNIRLTARDGDTALSVTNEKGTDTVTELPGTYIGHCAIGEFIIIFLAGSPNRIVRMRRKFSGVQFDILYEGYLNFSESYPIEAIGDYENEYIQKVYWVDGLNQPRVINVVKDRLGPVSYNDSSFNFLQDLALKEKVSVTKQSGSGLFPSGCIQYCFTYYNKYGQETGIAYTTPLLYINFNDRAGSPEEKIPISFTVKIEHTDRKFEYIRLYSIVRTSLDATPAVKRVTDIPVKDDTVYYTDNNSTGNDVDPTYLMYVGGEEIVASTICSKDGTLFLGDIKMPRVPVQSTYEELATDVRSLRIHSTYREINVPRTMTGDNYNWNNSLNAECDGALTNPAGFKWSEHYRLGLQFQYKNGKWSEPIFVGDSVQTTAPVQIWSEGEMTEEMQVPNFYLNITNCKKGREPGGINFRMMYDSGYRKIRGIVVFPRAHERLVSVQGMECPTVYNIADRTNDTIHAQSSWFTRPFVGKTFLGYMNEDFKNDYVDSDYWVNVANNKSNQPYIGIDITNSNNVSWSQYGAYLQFNHRYSLLSYRDRGAEIQGVPAILSGVNEDYVKDALLHENGIVIREDNNHSDNGEQITNLNNLGNLYFVDQSVLSFHSPDVEFDDRIQTTDFRNYKCRRVGLIQFIGNFGDINIQTKTPPIGVNSTGFIHNSLRSEFGSGGRSLSAGLFYSDYLVDEDGNSGVQYERQKYDFLFMVYPFHRTGSLNNDISREGQSALLKTKTISNFKLTNTHFYSGGYIRNLLASSNIGYGDIELLSSPQLFMGDSLSMIRLPKGDSSDVINKHYNYYGDIDKVLTPPARFGFIFSNDNKDSLDASNGSINFEDTADEFWYSSKYGLYKGRGWAIEWEHIGDKKDMFRYNKDLVSMRYRSTTHLVLRMQYNNMQYIDYEPDSYCDRLYMLELFRDPLETDFGGTSESALLENLWYPAGEPVDIEDNIDNDDILVYFDYGDTWYQRYDCLRTYPYAEGDPNRIVDIVSFMCETRVNMDGRYDRNRGQLSNLYMSPINYNLINPVYTQHNNFFSYKLMDSELCRSGEYPTNITWSLQKTAGADIDSWTSINMGSSITVDGNKGKVNALRVSNDKIFCFQDKGISLVLFNSRVQIPASDGVPIEISNSYKVDGIRYLYDGVGCSNKESIAISSVLYFRDYFTGDMMGIGDGITSLGVNLGFSNYFRNSLKDQWYPVKPDYGCKSMYDSVHKDLYVMIDNDCIGYSEPFGQFISFYSYDHVDAMFNLGDETYCIKDNTLYRMFTGDYNKFFGEIKPSSITYVSNASPTIDKIFTNLEMRADFYNGDELCTYDFFDNLRVWDEYQDTGDTALEYSPDERLTNVRRKFRLWGVNIGRASGRRDRIRNTWAKVKLDFTPSETKDRFELHDVTTVYYT